MVFQIRYSIVLIILFSLIGSSIFIPNSSAQEESQIPDWVKNVAGWWATNDISEKELIAEVNKMNNKSIMSYKDVITYYKNEYGFIGKIKKYYKDVIILILLIIILYPYLI